MRSPVFALPHKVCSQYFIGWSLALSFVLRNVDIDSSLFTLTSCKSASRLRKVVLSSYGTWVRAVVYAQYKAVFGSGSLFPGYHARDVDPCEVVKISTKLFCPSDFGLGCTICGIVYPSVFNAFQRPSLSNGLFAIRFRRVFNLLSNQPSRSNMGQTELQIEFYLSFSVCGDGIKYTPHEQHIHL